MGRSGWLGTSPAAPAAAWFTPPHWLAMPITLVLMDDGLATVGMGRARNTCGSYVRPSGASRAASAASSTPVENVRVTPPCVIEKPSSRLLSSGTVVLRLDAVPERQMPPCGVA